jgi:hypothetical protein
MTPVFADSSYYIALMSSRDVRHEAAVRWSRTCARPVVTTEFVLLEVANSFCASHRRGAFGRLLGDLQADPNALVLPASGKLYRAGLDLYLQRSDKDWSLTDCISFVAMQQQGLTEALTGDHHFEQAGFKALLQ